MTRIPSRNTFCCGIEFLQISGHLLNVSWPIHKQVLFAFCLSLFSPNFSIEITFLFLILEEESKLLSENLQSETLACSYL